MVKRQIHPSTNKDGKKSRHDAATKKKKQKPIPVTILSGFLGSGKTTLLRHILTSKDHSLKVAVIVNDMAELNIDGQTIERMSDSSDSQRNNGTNNSNNGSNVVKAKREVVKLDNGCICCTLRGDLIREISRIQSEAKFDYVLIESTGIAEPQQVAESFCVDPDTQELAGNGDSMLWNSARLDTCVTVVDAVNFPDYLSSLKRFEDVFQDGLDDSEEGEGRKSISELMVEQVEFANVVIINKVDLVSTNKVETTQKLIRALNPKAKVMTGSYGKVDLAQILNTHLFNMEEARDSPGWLLSLQDGGVTASKGEADEYGVTSFVFRSRRPFHPNRLYTFLTGHVGLCFAQEWNSSPATTVEATIKMKKEATTTPKDGNFGCILRSKGTCWIAGRDEFETEWAHSGRIIQLNPTTSWFCNVHRTEWQGVESKEECERIEGLFFATKEDGSRGEELPYGDRRQELVFIGTNLKQQAIEEELNRCLLTDEEMVDHAPDLPPGMYVDPLPPSLVRCDEAKSLVIIGRHGQNQHFRIFPNFAFTLSHLSLNVIDHEYAKRIVAVKIWLDKPDTVRRGCLLATLRPEKYEQHAMSIKLLPREDEGGKEEGHDHDRVINHRIRIEVIITASPARISLNDVKDIVEKMDACEVHIFGTVEPLPFSKAADEGDDGDDDDDNDNEECETGQCQ